MKYRAAILAIGSAAVLAIGTAAMTQQATQGERLTFVAANADQAGPTGEGRMKIVIKRWSPDSERDQLLSVLKTHGGQRLAESFRQGSAVGYITFPGNLEYILRFACRVPGPDGGQDVVLATDYPVDVWWSPMRTSPPASVAEGTLIELHLNKDGRGEGKLSVGTQLQATHDGRLFGLQNYAKQPVLLTDVQREHRVTS